MSKQNPFADLDALRRTSETVRLNELRDKPAGEPKSRKRKQPHSWQRRFVTLPWTWAERLQKAKSLSTWRVAVLLLYEHWRRDGPSVVVSNTLVQNLGVPPRSKARALVELQELDLITVERRRRRSPRVTLKHLDQS